MIDRIRHPTSGMKLPSVDVITMTVLYFAPSWQVFLHSHNIKLYIAPTLGQASYTQNNSSCRATRRQLQVLRVYIGLVTRDSCKGDILRQLTEGSWG